MSKYPEHNRQHFFKYTTACTAVKVLKSSTVRYSSPLRFNDPFDVQSGLRHDFHIATVPDRILDHIEKLVLLPERPPVSETSALGPVVLLMWEKKATDGFPRERMREIFREPLIELAEKIAELQQQIQTTWWKNYLPRLRVFSVSEEHDNLLMWSHYADYHRGVVFQFRVLPQADNPLCIAKPVRYCATPRPLQTWSQLVDNAFTDQPFDESILKNYAYFKSEIWSYEREWRVWDLPAKAESDLFTDYPLWPGEIGAVYFGCKIDPKMRNEIVNLMAAHPDAKIFQASKSVDEFRLVFQPH